MWVVFTYDREKEVIHMGGRTDPPWEADVKGTLRPGDMAFGKSFDDLKEIASIETDPATGEVVRIEARAPFVLPPIEEIPAFLRADYIAKFGNAKA
jgi:hypothetical protein